MYELEFIVRLRVVCLVVRHSSAAAWLKLCLRHLGAGRFMSWSVHTGEKVLKREPVLKNPAGLPVFLCFSSLCLLDFHTTTTLIALLVTGCVGGFPPHHQVIFHDASWVAYKFSSIMTHLPGDRSHGLRAPSHKTAPTLPQMPAADCRSPGSPQLLSHGLQIRGSHDPFLRFH